MLDALEIGGKSPRIFLEQYFSPKQKNFIFSSSPTRSLLVLSTNWDPPPFDSQKKVVENLVNNFVGSEIFGKKRNFFPLYALIIGLLISCMTQLSAVKIKYSPAETHSLWIFYYSKVFRDQLMGICNNRGVALIRTVLFSYIKLQKI